MVLLFHHYSIVSHDIYRGNYFDTQSISREIFKDRGYQLVFPDVAVFWEGGYKQYEDYDPNYDSDNYDYEYNNTDDE
jgi:hypothetical protein